MSRLFFSIFITFLVGCASFSQPSQQVVAICSQQQNAFTPAQRANNPSYNNCLERESQRASNISSQPTNSGGNTAKGLADFFNGIADGIAGAQKFQQPPPGFVYIPPGTSRSSYMTCTPDGRGGYYCK